MGVHQQRSVVVKVNGPHIDDTTRRAPSRELCTAFTRLAPADADAATPKRRGTAIALTETEDGSGTSFLLTHPQRTPVCVRAAHNGALPGRHPRRRRAARRWRPRPTRGLRRGASDLALGEAGAAAEASPRRRYPTHSGYLITPVVVWAGERAAIDAANRARSLPCIASRSTPIEADDISGFVTIPVRTRAYSVSGSAA